MRPHKHFITSLALGAAVWFFAKSLSAGLVCFMTGFFLDIDHVIEYLIHYGWRNFTYKKCVLACVQAPEQGGQYPFKKIYFIFHSGEIALLLWFLAFFTKNLYLFAGALGYSGHMVLDCIGNPVYLSAYFFIWRARKRFDTDKLFSKERIYKMKKRLSKIRD